MIMQKCDVGLIGAGVMGANLALNITDHGFSVAVNDISAEKVRAFAEGEGKGRRILPAYSVAELADGLSRPRAIILLVPAGSPVDDAITALLPHLEPGDLIIDSGNSHFTDTIRRDQGLTEKGLQFIGMGISGGEAGARNGPSLMPGGSGDGFLRVEKILKAVAANVDGEPCVAYLGPGAAGHYVKMVHNGIEYGMMQLIAETYDLMKRGLKMRSAEMADVYEGWDKSDLNSYLTEITARIFRRKDHKKEGALLIDFILDRAEQKGTGKWTTMDAMGIQVPTPVIDTAVAMRNMSVLLSERTAASGKLKGPENEIRADRDYFLNQLKNALHAAMVLTYSQGFSLLRHASAYYKFQLDLETVARIWRGGCIIRAALLEKIRSAYREEPVLANPLVSPVLAQIISANEADLRAVVKAAAESGLPAPGMMAALAYYDAYRSAWLPANLIEAQRDYFGAHTYERTDISGYFHTDWSAV